MRLQTILAASALAAGLAAAGVAGAPTRWDLPSGYAPHAFHTENLVRFASDVDQATGGRLKITVHADATLFKAPEIKRAVQGGQAQLGEILLSNHANEWPPFGADGIPFLADSYDASMRLYRAQRPLMEKRLSEQGLLLLYAVPWPPQGLFTKRPVEAAAHLRGMKWRAFNPATARIAELVGAQPVTVQAAELALALATGVVEGYMSSGATGDDTRTWAHLRHFYDLQAWLPKNAVVVNRAAFDALDKPTQAALLRAGAAAETRGWQMSRARNAESLERLRTRGMTVAPPSAQLRSDMRKVGETMLQEWLQKAGRDGQALVDAYRKL